MIVTVEPDADAPRVKVETAASSVFRVQGTTRTPVRGEVSAGVIYDYEIPQETPVTYDDGLAVSGLVEMPDMGLWLVHLAQPALSRRVTLSSHDGWGMPSRSTSLDVPGGEALAVTFSRAADVGSLTVKLWSREEFDDFRALVADGSVLFMSAPYDLGIGSGYVLVGDVSLERVGQRTDSQFRRASLPFQFVRRPDWVTFQGVSWDTVASQWSSLASSWLEIEKA